MQRKRNMAGFFSTNSAGSGPAAFGIGLTYSMSLTVIKNWDYAASADLVLIAGEKAVVKTDTKGTKEVAKMRRAGYEGKGVSSLGGGRDIRRLANAKDALKTASTAGKLAVALKAVPYLCLCLEHLSGA